MYMDAFTSGGATLFRSTDNAVTWDSLYSPLSNSGYVERNADVVAQGDTILLALNPRPFDTTATKGIMRSSNGGLSWIHVYSSGRVGGIAFSQLYSTGIFAATEEGILRSDDFGITWTVYNNALPTMRLTDLLVDPYSDTLYVSTETHGVLKVWDFITDVTDSRDFIPHEFVLAQNYPNPFNPSTTIRFRIGDLGFVSLKIFDLLGREVTTLVNEVRVPGEYTVLWDASGFASGVYLYKLISGKYNGVGKMLVIR
jgi:hypothetical protein